MSIRLVQRPDKRQWRGIILLIVGATSFVIGLVDVLFARFIEDRILGLLLTLTGGALLAGGYMLLRGGDWRFGMLAAIAGFVVGITFGKQAWPDVTQIRPRIVCVAGYTFALFCVVSGCVTWFRDRVRRATSESPSKAAKSEGTKVETDKDISGAQAALLGLAGTILAAVLALGGTWYSSRYVPSLGRPALNVEATILTPSDGRDSTAIPISIRVKNAGSSELRVLNPYYEIHGLPVEPAELPIDLQRMARPFEESQWQNQVQRLSTVADSTSATLVQSGRFFTDGMSLAPNEDAITKLLVIVPKDKYASIRVAIDVSAAEANRLHMSRDPESMGNALDFRCYEDYFEEKPSGELLTCRDVWNEWSTETPSLFRKIVSHPRIVVTGLIFRETELTTRKHGGIPEFPFPYVNLVYEGNPFSPRQDEALRTRVEHFWIYRTAEMSLWEKRAEDSKPDELAATDGE
jgi:hypothetical protein